MNKYRSATIGDITVSSQDTITMHLPDSAVVHNESDGRIMVSVRPGALKDFLEAMSWAIEKQKGAK